MVRLSREIEVLRRLSDPYWFQVFGCVLGFDWHSSGVTTTVTGALKEGLRGTERDLGIYVGGGKGAVSRRTPGEIVNDCEALSIDAKPLVSASRMSAKVDSAAVQDGYQLYHHAFFFTPEGGWCVVQQGMSDADGMARRYHWLASQLRSFVNEPHAAVCAEREAPTLNYPGSRAVLIRCGRQGRISLSRRSGDLRQDRGGPEGRGQQGQHRPFRAGEGAQASGGVRQGKDRAAPRG